MTHVIMLAHPDDIKKIGGERTQVIEGDEVTFKAGCTCHSVPGKALLFSKEEFDAMTQDEVNDRWAEVEPRYKGALAA